MYWSYEGLVTISALRLNALKGESIDLHISRLRFKTLFLMELNFSHWLTVCILQWDTFIPSFHAIIRRHRKTFHYATSDLQWLIWILFGNLFWIIVKLYPSSLFCKPIKKKTKLIFLNSALEYAIFCVHVLTAQRKFNIPHEKPMLIEVKLYFRI